MMDHNHSAMHRTAIQAVSRVFVSQSCEPNCLKAERLAALRKAIPQVRSAQNEVLVAEATAEPRILDIFTKSLSHGPPPAPVSPNGSFVTVLRV
jgi:hypothetical protein